MSPMIFDASVNEEKAKRERLEQQLQEQIVEAQSKASATLPAREENAVKAVKNADAVPSDAVPGEVEELTDDNSHTETTDGSSTNQENEKESKLDQLQEEVGLSVKDEKKDPESYSELLRNEPVTRNPLSAFALRPRGAHFASQHDNEQILMVLRQHPVVNVQWILIAIIMILVPFLAIPLFPIFVVIPAQFQLFSFMGWYLLTLAFVLENFLHWYFNIYILTDERIVDIDFYSLIYRSISSAKIENVEDTTATTKGVLGAVFNFGDVSIQTAAEKREFEFVSVPQPAVVTKFINELLLEEEREKLEGRVM